MSDQLQARSLRARREAALERLRSGGNLWVRAAVGSPTDVLVIDALAIAVAAYDVDEAAKDGYAEASRIPRGTPGFVYVQLRPERMQVWKGPAEFAGRTVMRDGEWLDGPAA